MNTLQLFVTLYIVVGYLLGLAALKLYAKKKKVSKFDVVEMPVFVMVTWPIILISIVLGCITLVVYGGAEKVANKLNKEG